VLLWLFDSNTQLCSPCKSRDGTRKQFIGEARMPLELKLATLWLFSSIIEWKSGLVVIHSPGGIPLPSIASDAEHQNENLLSN
jgi:hypothetical protein